MSLRSMFSGAWFLILGLAAAASAAPKEEAGLTPKALSTAAGRSAQGEDAERLAKEIRAGSARITCSKGRAPRSTSWRWPGRSRSPGGTRPLRLGWSPLKGFQPVFGPGRHDRRLRGHHPAPGRSRDALGLRGLRQADRASPQAQPAAGPTRSRSTPRIPTACPVPTSPRASSPQQPPWKSKIYDGTSRDWWVYVPAQYKDDTPACVMVFQDGGGYRDFVPTVFDNLIARGDMPVTVAILINPGEQGRGQRSVEYDTLSDRYARFLLEEILPEVEKTVKLRHDPEEPGHLRIQQRRICAWTVAWERPDEFRKVLSWVGSFTNIASGKSGREGATTTRL